MQAHPELSAELLSTAFEKQSQVVTTSSSGSEEEKGAGSAVTSNLPSDAETPSTEAAEGRLGVDAGSDEAQLLKAADGEAGSREVAIHASGDDVSASSRASAAGRLLRYIHHPGVSDALLQLATCDHRASHAGGAGA